MQERKKFKLGEAGHFDLNQFNQFQLLSTLDDFLPQGNTN